MLEKTDDPTVEAEPYRRVAWALLPFLLGCCIVAMIDRLNVGYAKLHFLADLHCDEAVFGMAAGSLYVGYILFQVPSNLMLERIGLRLTLLRIMVLLTSCATAAAGALLVLPLGAPSVAATTLCLAVAVVGLFGFLALFWTIPTAVGGSGARAGGLSLVSAIGAIGSVVSPPFMGWVQVLTGSLYGAITVLAVLFLFSLLALHACIPARTAGAVAC